SNQVRMADLRALVESLGCRDVSTYIASGNVILTGDEGGAAAIAAGLERGIEAELGLRIRVIVRSAEELATCVADDPFPDAAGNRAFVGFLDAEPERAAVDRLAAVESGPDEFQVSGRTLYLHCPDGIGRSKLAERIGTGLGVAVTTRNMTTVRKLLDLAST
ncbi:MAG: DUF1697 domain-containing protein, partial [Jiangellaceae bacterium]